MKYSHATTSFWIIFGFVLLIFAFNSFNKNQNGEITYRTCVESTGGHVDPRSGDGPECEQYGFVTSKESKMRSGLRGVGEALIPALLAAGIAFYVGSKLDDREEKYVKKKQDNS